MSNPFKHIFIGGTGRSGSNILKAILSQHSACAALPFEPRYIIDPDGILDYYNGIEFWSPYVQDYKLRRLFDLLDGVAERSPDDLQEISRREKSVIDPIVDTPPRYFQWELDKHIPGFNKCVDQLKSNLIGFKYDNYWVGSESHHDGNNYSIYPRIKTKEQLQPILSNFLTDIYDLFLDSEGAFILIDDSTFSILHADQLIELIPNTGIIHVYRDPRDVIASLKTQRWAPSQLDQAIQWYGDLVDRWNIVKGRLSGDQYIELSFEQLVQDYSGAMDKLSQWGGTDFTGVRNLIDPNKHNMGRYLKELSPAQIRQIEDGVGRHLDALGYA